MQLPHVLGKLANLAIVEIVVAAMTNDVVAFIKKDNSKIVPRTNKARKKAMAGMNMKDWGIMKTSKVMLGMEKNKPIVVTIKVMLGA
ncbi:hypothetical protein V7S43_016383 [Phytophthora oleae]|uniref:Uncharacterized protein n=1 Tax=Phytophthora oleae TaxID=2107226 RepID=A0ABD3EWB7_9STRA